MSEFDNLKNEGEQYAKDHPQQVHEAEQDAENALKSKLGPGDGQQQDQQGQQGQQGQQEGGQQGQND